MSGYSREIVVGLVLLFRRRRRLPSFPSLAKEARGTEGSVVEGSDSIRSRDLPRETCGKTFTPLPQRSLPPASYTLV